VPPPPPPGRPPPPPGGVCRVPRVIGVRLGTARARIRGALCAVGRVGKAKTRRGLRGRVVAQSPRAGTIRRRGFPVKLVIGRR
jgi:beta-lactam-binding protein with PASTA domain